jgi:hypothetical protein
VDFFGCGLLVYLKNKGILLKLVLGGVKSYFFQGIIFWVGLGGWRNKGNIPCFYFFSFFIIWWLNKDIFPRKYLKKINVIFWGHQTWQNFQHKKIISRIFFKIIFWNQTLNTFNHKLKNNSISTFCVTKLFMQMTKKLMFTNIYVYQIYILNWKWK